MGHENLKALYGKLDYLIGTRFHSVIFALTSGTPAIAIEYEHKTGGIMRDLELDKWVCKIEHVKANHMKGLFDQLVEQRAGYVHRLNTHLPAYIAEANNVPYIIQEVLTKRSNIFAAATPLEEQT